MKKIQTVSFSDNRDEKVSAVKKRVILLTAIILAAGIISAFFLLSGKGFSIRRFLGVREELTTAQETTSAEEEPSSTQTEVSGLNNFLFICCDDDKNVSFSFIVSCIADEARIKIKPVDPEMPITVFTGTMSFSKAFLSVDTNRLKDGFAEKNIRIDRYAVISEDNFVSMMHLLGPVTIPLEKEFVYYTDNIMNVCPPGDFEFTADALLKYFKTCGQGGDNLKSCSNAAKIITETFFNTENFSKGEILFEKLINFVTTDITVFDFITAQPIIEAMLLNGVTVTVNY